MKKKSYQLLDAITLENTVKSNLNSRSIEESLLGTLCIKDSYFEQVRHIVSPLMFLHHKDLAQVLWDMIEANEKPTAVAIIDKLQERGISFTNMDYANLCKMADKKAIDNASSISLAFKKYKLSTLCIDTVEDIASGTHADQALSAFNFELAKLDNVYSYKFDFNDRSDVVSFKESFNKTCDNPNLKTGVPSGLKSIDYYTGTFGAGQVTMLSALPGEGKSTLAMQFLYEAQSCGFPCGFISGEMTSNQIWPKFLSFEVGVSKKDIDSGNVTPKERELINSILDEWAKERPLKVEYFKRDINEVVSSIRSLAQAGCKLVVFDNLSLCRGYEKMGRRDIEVSAYAQDIKNAAVLCGIHVIIIAHEARSSLGSVKASSVKDGGDGDVDIMMTIKTLDEHKHNQSLDVIPTSVYITKNRSLGLTGKIDLFYSRTFDRYLDSDKYGSPIMPIPAGAIVAANDIQLRGDDLPLDW